MRLCLGTHIISRKQIAKKIAQANGGVRQMVAFNGGVGELPPERFLALIQPKNYARLIAIQDRDIIAWMALVLFIPALHPERPLALMPQWWNVLVIVLLLLKVKKKSKSRCRWKLSEN
jgi:hypothetical protein